MRRFLFLMLLLALAGCGAEPAPGYTQISQAEAMEMMAREDGHLVVDVRRQEEYDAGHIPGAILVPNETIGDTPPAALPDFDQILLLYCRTGNRSKQAAQKLAELGYTRVYEFGGIQTWEGEKPMSEPAAALLEALGAGEVTVRFSVEWSE